MLQDEINTGEEKNEANQVDSQQIVNLLVGDKY
jgi:hypothetical protein